MTFRERLEKLKKRRANDLALQMKRERDRMKFKAFLRGRKPVFMKCPDGMIRTVKPGMNVAEIGTNVIPLPCKYEEF